jgi:hypothetical protein
LVDQNRPYADLRAINPYSVPYHQVEDRSLRVYSPTIFRPEREPTSAARSNSLANVTNWAMKIAFSL